MSGLSLAGVPLLRKTAAGFAPRPSSQIAELMRCAYDRDVDPRSVFAGLNVAARALNCGDLGRAMVATVRLGLPELNWDRATRIARAELRLANYNVNEPRDRLGQWTANGGANGTVSPKTRQARAAKRPQALPLSIAGSMPGRLAVGEVAAGGGPEDLVADGIAAATLGVGFLLALIAANRNQQTTAMAGGRRRNSSRNRLPAQRPEEDECEDLLSKDMINCQIVKATRGARKGFQCRSVAMERYSECLRGGLSNVRTPFYWGN
ncbi:MAG: hypothetical protein P4M09_02525 [Devosia sp.]|nr:hypothetical protein [Devosia sp.]